MGFIAWIIVGIVAGWIAEQVMKTNMGILMNLVVGIIGAFIGGFLFSLVGIGEDGGLLWSILVATIGAIVLLWVVGMVRKKTA
ncbi:GlsB/YeaQ/YmgE family stress response membrane protein [Rubrivirga sp. IMCC45206]|uniref:GlsB/YeaQ/YmgE family stress response membrane protein n=1 Tax=Rubrivirga sp. IMCC45206 TaxID=3391614 RepID=UPI003990213A